MITVKKIAELVCKLFLGYPMYFLSGFIYRKKNIWLFSSFDGEFKDNGRYLYQYLIDNPQYNIIPIWISKNKKSVSEARKYGKAYPRWELMGLFYSLIGKVYVSSGGIHDVNFYTSRNAINVNLWHGIPLKKVGFDSVNSSHLKKLFEKSNNYYINCWKKMRYPLIYVKYDFFLSPSKYVADYSFKSAFRVQDENIIIAKYPRVSYLQECQPLCEYQKYNKVFLYAPTWRDDGRNFFEQAKFDFEKLNKLMINSNSIFLIKLHPATNLNIDLSVYSNLKIIPNKIDPIKLMKSTDCLITDYSSIYLDYIILDRPIIHFVFDLEEYVLTSREMYFDYDETLSGVKVENFFELYQAISDILLDKDLGENIRHRLKDRFLNNIQDGNDKIVKTIQQKLSGDKK